MELRCQEHVPLNTGVCITTKIVLVHQVSSPFSRFVRSQDQGLGYTDLLNPVYNGDAPLDYHDGVTFCPDGSFCCGPQNFTCCRDNLGHAIIDYGNTATMPSSSASLSSYHDNLHISTSSISQCSTSSITLSTSNLPAVGLATAVPTSTPFTSSNSAKNPSASPSRGLSSGTSAAIGTGFGLCGLAAFVGAVTFLYRRKIRLSRKNEHTEHKGNPWLNSPYSTNNKSLLCV